MKDERNIIKKARNYEKYKVRKFFVALLTGLAIDFGGTMWILNQIVEFKMFNYAFFVTASIMLLVITLAYIYYFKIRDDISDGQLVAGKTGKARIFSTIRYSVGPVVFCILAICLLLGSLYQDGNRNVLKSKAAYVAFKVGTLFNSHEIQTLDAINEAIEYDRGNHKLIRERAKFQVEYGTRLKAKGDETAHNYFDFAIEDYRNVAQYYETDPEYYYERGMAFLMAGASRTDEALGDFLSAIELYDGNDIDIKNKYRFGYIRTCKEHNVDDKDLLFEGYAMFNDMVEENDESNYESDWHRDIAEISQKLGINENEILEMYDRAIAENSYDASLYAERAEFLEPTEENLQAIIDDYDKAINCTPDNIYYYYRRGWAYYVVGGNENNQKALADYEEVLKRDSKYYSAYAGKAYVYGNMEDYDQAIENINKAIKLKEYASYYEARGSFYFKKEEYDQAIADYEKAISLNGNVDYCRRRIVSAYYRKGDNYEKVRELADEEIAAHKNAYLSNIYCTYGHTYYHEGNYEEALIKYRAAFNYGKSVGVSADTLAFYLDNCGDVYAELGKNEMAEKEYARAQALLDKTSSEWGDYGYNRALAMYRQKDYKRAIECLEDVIQYTDNPSILRLCHILKGHSHYSIVEYDRAIYEYTLSEEQTQNPVDRAYSFRWMADAHFQLGEKEAAIQCGERAVNLDPTNEEYKEFYNKIIKA